MDSIEEFRDWQDLLGSGEYIDVPDSILEADGQPISFISPQEIAAALWLAREIRVHPTDLIETLEALRRGDPELYRVSQRQKKDGSWKEFCAPNERLMKIQERINRRILALWKPAPHVFGFSGGSIEDALTPHLPNKSMLHVDLVEAFPTVTREDILMCLIQGRETYSTWEWNGRRRRRKYVVAKHGYFSWHAARILSELVTFKGRLIRGAPTSPRMFDQVCGPLDKALEKLAGKVKGTYTRFADNIYFSMPTEEFPQPVRNAILKRIEEGKRHHGPKFEWHKLKIVSLEGEAVRALGLNLLGGKVHNTRAFKHRVRLSVHHVTWLLDHGMDWEEAWLKLRGQMQFARTATLPPQLCSAYAELEERVASLS